VPNKRFADVIFGGTKWHLGICSQADCLANQIYFLTQNPNSLSLLEIHLEILTRRINRYLTFIMEYRRITKVAAPVIFGFSSQKGPLFSGSRYLRVAVTFGWLKNVCTVTVVSDKADL